MNKVPLLTRTSIAIKRWLIVPHRRRAAATISVSTATRLLLNWWTASSSRNKHNYCNGNAVVWCSCCCCCYSKSLVKFMYRYSSVRRSWLDWVSAWLCPLEEYIVWSQPKSPLQHLREIEWYATRMDSLKSSHPAGTFSSSPQLFSGQHIYKLSYVNNINVNLPRNFNYSISKRNFTILSF